MTAAVEESIKNIAKAVAAAEERNSEDEDAANNLEEFSIIPTPNKDAKSPNEVYQLFDTLSLTQAEFVRCTLELSKKFAIATNESIKQWHEMNIYPEYVCESLSKLINSNCNQQYKIQKCKQLAYMNYLILCYRLKSSQLRSKNPMATFEVSDSTVNKLFSLYTVCSTANAHSKSTRSMPRRLKDKLTCHILILALHIEDFSVGLDLLQKDLKLAMQRLSDFSQALGCFVKSQVTTVNNKKVVSKTANLTLPLNDISKIQAKKRARKN